MCYNRAMPLALDLPTFPKPINPYRPPEPHAIAERIEPGSIAEEIGIEPGDEILSINGQRMEDVIDYRFLVAEPEVEVVVAPRRDASQAYTVTVEKDPDETLGVWFTADVFDGIRICTNDCDFCFVYQNRRRMRKSVYIKDDDYRLSFLHGEFITLTNLTEQNWQRIRDYHLSPLYVSIHATDPEVRARMIRNPDGAKLREHLDRLFSYGIQIHGQVVLCPGINDGAMLERTVADMAACYPKALSLAVVPVGLTRLRAKLPHLDLVSPEGASRLVESIRDWQRDLRRRLGTRFVFASDEMYLLAGEPTPGAPAYEGFPQYENGVGMVTRLRGEWRRLRPRLPTRLARPRRVTIVSGTLAAPVLQPLVDDLNAVEGLQAGLHPVRNDFFGDSVTVAGLIAGEDIAAQLRDQPLGDAVLLPAAALRGDRFIDDLTVASLAAQLGAPVEVVEPTARGLMEGAVGMSAAGGARGLVRKGCPRR